jgi:hypothetical protein
MSELCVLYDRECIDCGECEVCDLDKTKKCDNCEQCLGNIDRYKTLSIKSYFEIQKEKKKPKDR